MLPTPNVGITLHTLDMNSEELKLFPFVITSGRNSDNCDIILIEIDKEGRKMPLHERWKVVLYKSSL